MIMKPIPEDIIIYQGATFLLMNRWLIGEDGNLKPVDFQGCTARMQIRGHVLDTDVLLELTTENDRISLLDDGWISRTIAAEDTAMINWKKGVFDFEIEFPGGFVRRLWEGRVVVSKEVTR